MGQDLSETTLKMSPYITRLGQNSSKGLKKVQNSRQMGKNFKINFINSKKLHFSPYHLIFLPNIVLLEPFFTMNFNIQLWELGEMESKTVRAM